MFWLEQTIRNRRNLLKKGQQRYKKNYRALLRRHTKRLLCRDYVYHRRECKDSKESCHKLAPVADGHYLIKSVQNTTVVIEIRDESFQRVSASPVTLAPAPITGQELREVIRPMTEDELGTDFSTQMDLSFDYLLRREESGEDILRRSKLIRHRNKNVSSHSEINPGLDDLGLPLARAEQEKRICGHACETNHCSPSQRRPRSQNLYDG